nr:equistatin precursor [Actinia equina]AAO12123.1 equistatin [synthetic construct]
MALSQNQAKFSKGFVVMIWVLFIACAITSTEASLTKCQQLQASANSGLIGTYVPQCKETGEFEEKQCWGSTGYCWCVDEDGKEILGTKIRGSPDCSRRKAALTLCQMMQAIIVNVPGWCGPPSCKADGSFDEVQCCASNGECYCVDKKGKELEGTRQQGRPTCERHLSECEEARIKAHSNSLRVEMFVPECLEDGSYNPVQCWPSTGYCWCVDEGGVKVPGSDVRFKRPTC